MKCPHCAYEHEPIGNYNYKSGNYDNIVVGEAGGFYSLPIELVRHEPAYYDSRQTKNLYACPSCMKTFVEG